MTAAEKKFRKSRESQLKEWQAKHPGSPKKAAQHLHKPGTKTKATTKRKSTS